MPVAFIADPARVARQLFIGAAFALLELSLASCALHRAPPRPAPVVAKSQHAATVPAMTPTARVSAPPREHRAGVIRVIGHGRRFVLIEVPPTGAASLPDGQLLRCASSPVMDAPTTATLSVARERRRPFVVADVVDGEPHVGDTVFVVQMAPPTPGNPTVLPTATADVLPITLPAPSPNVKPR